MKIVPMSVQLVDSMGSDLSVVNAARVSFDKISHHEGYYACDPDKEDGILSYRIKKEDEKLIEYLAKHNHWSPFAHAFASFRIKAPIFVARQLVKHQVGLSWNEVSRRYVDSEPEFWFPKEWRGKPVNAKQGSDGIFPDDNPDYNLSMWVESQTMEQLNLYLTMVHDGVAPEQARMILPQNTMTEWIWSGTLYAFARICNLRLDAHAQQETRQVAEGISKEMQQLFPISWSHLVT